MTLSGTIDSVWRYPVKSMRGEELEEAFIGFPGVYGDRLYAFVTSKGLAGFPYLTAREQKQILLCRPRFRHPEHAARPANLAAAEELAPGVTPLYADLADLIVDVELPSGQTLAIDDPGLIGAITEGLGAEHEVKLVRSERALTDCRPVSLLSLQTVRAVGDELDTAIDKRRFRANFYVDFGSAAGFVEDGLIGQKVRLGPKVVISILERDPRCKMITLDPDSAESNPKVLRTVAQGHDGMAGVFGAVLVEGTVRRGDEVVVLS
jgi:uncharacterized protein YcbX